MGWGNCGTDSKGRPIGYVFEATCDHPGCDKKIDRGLSYACGGMHGNDEYSCEKYFCPDHLKNHIPTSQGHWISVCDECYKAFIAHQEDNYGKAIPGTDFTDSGHCDPLKFLEMEDEFHREIPLSKDELLYLSELVFRHFSVAKMNGQLVYPLSTQNIYELLLKEIKHEKD